MKSKRLNLCTAVRNMLHTAGYSSRAVVNAVNSALGELEAKSESVKMGNSRITKTFFKVSETVNLKYEASASTLPLRFDAWHTAIMKAEDIASFETIAIPGIFKDWFDKFAKKSEKELASEIAETVK